MKMLIKLSIIHRLIYVLSKLSRILCWFTGFVLTEKTQLRFVTSNFVTQLNPLAKPNLTI